MNKKGIMIGIGICILGMILVAISYSKYHKTKIETSYILRRV